MEQVEDLDLIAKNLPSASISSFVTSRKSHVHQRPVPTPSLSAGGKRGKFFDCFSTVIWWRYHADSFVSATVTKTEKEKKSKSKKLPPTGS